MSVRVTFCLTSPDDRPDDQVNANIKKLATKVQAPSLHAQPGTAYPAALPGPLPAPFLLQVLRGSPRRPLARAVSRANFDFPQNSFVWRILKIDSRPPSRQTVPHWFPRHDLGRRPAPLRPASHQAISAYPAADPDRLPPLEQHLARPTQSCLPCIRPIPSLHRRIHPREAFSSTVALLPTLQTRPSITLNQPHPTTATPSSNQLPIPPSPTCLP